MPRSGHVSDRTARQAAHSEQPWRWRADWERGRVPANTRASLRFAWGIAAFWNFISWPVAVIASRELPRNKLAALAWLFPLVGCWLMLAALRVTRRWRRFGDTWFDMSPVPASPGGSMRGTIHVCLTKDGRRPATPVLLQLTCLRRSGRPGADDNHVTESIVWREEHCVPETEITSGPRGSAIPVYFDLPPDAVDTTAIDGGPGIFWVLAASAALHGVDLYEEYDVPVYGTGTASTPRHAVARRQAQAAPPPVDAADLIRDGIHVRAVPGGVSVRCRAARNGSFLAGTTSFLLIWTGAWWLQRVIGVPWLFQALTLLFEGLLVVVCIDLWLSTTTVTVSDMRVSRRYAILGVGRTRSWPCRDVTTLALRIGSQTQGRTGTPYYDVRASLAGGRTVTLVPRIRSKRQAEWLVARLRSAIG